MGFYDRDYERDDYGGYRGSYGEPGVRLRMPQSMTVRLILINVVAYLIQFIIPAVNDILPLYARWWWEPWRVIGLVTGAFMHDVHNLQHLLFNMLGLYFFGTALEERMRRTEFTTFYMAALLFASIVWSTSEAIISPLPGLGPAAVGASGAIAALFMLFVFYNPNATVLLFFVLPVKAWVAGLIWVGADVLGALNVTGTQHIAYSAHLGGMLFALLYYKFDWHLSRWMPRDFKLPSFKRRPNLKVHRGDADAEDSLDAQVDRILKKIKEQGQDSLTAAEKRTLQKGSAAYRKRHQ